MNNSLTYSIQTFGCQMNVNDSDWIARSLHTMGFKEQKPELADVYILNTCTVRDKPEQKVYSELGRIVHYCKVHNKAVPLLCVGGCVAQQIGDSLRKRFPQVRLIFGTDGISRVPESIKTLLEEKNAYISLLDFYESYQEKDSLWNTETQTPLSAFVNIMQGCNNFCTYCIVPYVRGRQKSRQSSEVIKECLSLAKKGCKEITLLGQNVNSFGKDPAGDGKSFTELLKEISAIDTIQRIQFLTSHPKDIDASLIQLFSENTKLMPRLHLPVQSGSNTILRKMNRGYTVESYLERIEELRLARPDILFSTDIIVGFPGETEEDFLQTIDVMNKVEYFTSFSFVYSDRPKAKASLFPEKVDRKEALQRLAFLQKNQNTLTEQVLQKLVGKQLLALIENKQEKKELNHTLEKELANKESKQADTNIEQWVASTDYGIKAYITAPKGTIKIGDFVSAQVIGTNKQSLLLQRM